MSNLELVETDALVEELLSRFAHAIFSGMKVKPYTTPELQGDCDTYEYYHWKGEYRTAQGLCLGMVQHINRHREEVSKPDDGSF